jgi:hypothetical protein
VVIYLAGPRVDGYAAAALDADLSDFLVAFSDFGSQIQGLSLSTLATLIAERHERLTTCGDS